MNDRVLSERQKVMKVLCENSYYKEQKPLPDNYTVLQESFILGYDGLPKIPLWVIKSPNGTFAYSPGGGIKDIDSINEEIKKHEDNLMSLLTARLLCRNTLLSDIADSALEIATEEASCFVSDYLPKGYQVWSNKEYSIANVAAMAAINYVLKAIDFPVEERHLDKFKEDSKQYIEMELKNKKKD